MRQMRPYPQVPQSLLLFAALSACSLSACQPAQAPEAPPAAEAPQASASVAPGGDVAPASQAAGAPSAAAPTADAAPAAGAEEAQAPGFVGKVWKVVESEGVQPGTTYAFLPDGTLVIESAPGNPPGQGKWTYADGKLSIEEEGATYPTDILRSDANHLDLRSHNPGGTLDIKLERVPDAALPDAP